MARLLQILLACSSLAIAAVAWAQSPDADAAAARAAVRAFHDALRGGNVERVKQLLAADAVVLENGNVESRDDYLRHHLDADIEFAKAVPAKVTGLEATVVGDAAWVRSSSTTQGTFHGRALKLAGAELMVLTRAASGWQIRAIHWSSYETK